MLQTKLKKEKMYLKNSTTLYVFTVPQVNADSRCNTNSLDLLVEWDERELVCTWKRVRAKRKGREASFVQ